MSQSGFTKVVNTNVQATAILNGVAGALSAISSTPGFTGYTIIKPTTLTTVLDDNTLLAISESGILLLDGSSATVSNRTLAVCVGDTKENAKHLINLFKLDSSNPKLIKVAKVGAPNPATYDIRIGNNSSALATTYAYVAFTYNMGAQSAVQVLSEPAATKSGYISVTKVSEEKIVFDVVEKQTPP